MNVIETGERPAKTVTPSEAALSASQRPEFFRLPKSGGDPFFGFTRSFYYEGEQRGYLELMRVQIPRQPFWRVPVLGLLSFAPLHLLVHKY